MIHRPPELTAASRTFVRWLDATQGWSRRRACVMSVLLCVAMLAIEVVTPITINTTVLYMFATAFAVWSMGEAGGLALGAAATIAATLLKHQEAVKAGIPVAGFVAGTWNTVTRFAASALLALIVNGLRSALALERWRAACDGLTGVLNKLAFDERMHRMVAQAAGERRALVLAYMDLDGFKAINDGYGHAAGDRVLRTFAAAAMQAVRRTDLFARIGGDEFVALLSVPSCEEGDAVAAMLHDRLSAILTDTGFAVTCSMGALVADATAMQADGRILDMADALMYEVKRSGKNALRIARGGRFGPTLRSAYQPCDGDDLAELLRRIDRADRALRPAGQRREAA